MATIVIPTFNRSDLLPEAIKSALAQTVECEVIVVDHGSTDNTPDVVGAWGPAVRYMRREIDSGPQFSWLDGVLLASHDEVKILHDDDWLDPSFMERCLAVLEPDVGFVFTAAHVTDVEKRSVNTLFHEAFPRSGVYGTRAERRRVAQMMISPTALVLRKQELLDGIYVNRLPFQGNTFHGAGADHYLKMVALLRYKKFGYVKEPLAYFRSHAGSITADAISTGKKAGLTAVYSDVFHYFLLLDFARATGLHRLVPSTYSLGQRIRSLLAFFPRYVAQVQKVGLVPLSLRKNKNYT
jgi:glycosyltransferase involved in cell wall biosynthesis